MRIVGHAVIGAVLGTAPDIALATFYSKEEWLPEGHPKVRLHRFLHHPVKSILFIVVLAWASHVLVDQVTPHRSEEDFNEKGNAKRTE